MAALRVRETPTPLASPTLDPERVACILADAEILGDRQAAAKWEIAERTLRLHRQRAAEDPEIAEAYQRKRKLLEQAWATDRRRVLRKLLNRVETLADLAGVEQLRDVVGALKIVGDLEVVAGALGGEQSGPDRAGQSPSSTSPLEAAAERFTH